MFSTSGKVRVDNRHVTCSCQENDQNLNGSLESKHMANTIRCQTSVLLAATPISSYCAIVATASVISRSQSVNKFSD